MPTHFRVAFVVFRMCEPRPQRWNCCNSSNKAPHDIEKLPRASQRHVSNYMRCGEIYVLNRWLIVKLRICCCLFVFLVVIVQLVCRVQIAHACTQRVAGAIFFFAIPAFVWCSRNNRLVWARRPWWLHRPQCRAAGVHPKNITNTCCDRKRWNHYL